MIPQDTEYDDRKLDRTGSMPGQTASDGDASVLIVDDDDLILSSLKRVLRREPYRIEWASNGAQALERMEKEEFQVVVTDMEMPKMNGLELLKIISKEYPDTLRMVVSAGSKSQTILEAINQGHIYQYLLKPWDDKILKVAIRRALEVWRLRMERRSLIAQLETQNRQLEKLVELRTKQILSAERQAEIGRHAAQIVHNLNNPMHALSAALELLSHLAETGPMNHQKIVSMLGMAQSAADDLKSIVSSILIHASDRSSSERVDVDVNAVIEKELALYDIVPEFKYEIEKVIELDRDLPVVLGNPLQLKQVIGNLVKNSIDAMESVRKKCLTIQTSRCDGMVKISVSDTGTGIRKEDLNRVFHPDFTTKPVGKGTGLGLASVKTMVEAYAGSIQVESSEGYGTTFVIQLPTKMQVTRPN